jgi:zinc transport system ATP-binding protein
MITIEFKDVEFSYAQIPVLSGVHFRLEGFQIASIIGPNGSGKTTLLKLMLGLLKPNLGEVLISGVSPVKTRKIMGYVPQHTLYDPRFPIGVRDVVAMGRLGQNLFGFLSNSDKTQVDEAIERVGMSHRAERSFAALSGGERQRILIARALVSQPQILLLDEPTSGVDEDSSNKLYELLKELSKTRMVIFVSHDTGIVSSVVEHVLCVNRSVAIHPVSELTGQTISELYLSDVNLVHHNHHCSDKCVSQ